MDFNIILDAVKDIFNQIKLNLFTFLPKIIVAILIILLGFLIAKLIKTIFVRFINKIDRLVPNKMIKEKIRTYIIEKPIAKFISGFVYWILIFFFLIIATETLGLPIVTAWLGEIIGYLPKLFSALIIVVVGIIGGMILRDLVTTAAHSAGIAYGAVLGRFVQIVVALTSILIGIHQIGIDIALLEGVFMLIIGGVLLAAALSFGLGAKVSVSNILACFYLQKIYKIGDMIKIGDKEGKIINVTSVAVILETPEGQTYIPAHAFNKENSDLLNEDNL